MDKLRLRKAKAVKYAEAAGTMRCVGSIGLTCGTELRHIDKAAMMLLSQCNAVKVLPDCISTATDKE